MKRLLSFVLLAVLIGLACARSNGAASPTYVMVTPTPASSVTTPVPITFAAPEQYQLTYTELDTALTSFINSLPATKGQPLNLGAELSYANGNIGEPLLNPSTISLVQKQLDVLKSMGVSEIVVAIKVPLFEPDFPHSADYLQFFKQVSAEIHARGMKLLVEAGPIFPGPSILRYTWIGPNTTKILLLQISRTSWSPLQIKSSRIICKSQTNRAPLPN